LLCNTALGELDMFLIKMFIVNVVLGHPGGQRETEREREVEVWVLVVSGLGIVEQ
jgi:hypothetical protein